MSRFEEDLPPGKPVDRDEIELKPGHILTLPLGWTMGKHTPQEGD